MAGNQKVKRNSRVFNPPQDNANQYDREVVAKPVDTFIQHKAMENAGARYRSLALGFRDFLPAANAFLKRKFDEKVAREEAQGEKLYYDTGSQRLSWEDFREKEDERLKKAGITTSVRNGYLKARMSNEANVFKESIYNAYNSGEAKITLPDGTEIPVSESDDPAVFTKWAMGYMNSYIRDNMGEDADPEYFAKIFVPQMEQTLNEVTAKHIAERNAVLKDRAISEQNKIIANTFKDIQEDDGSVTRDQSKRSAALSIISQTVKELQKNGVGIEAIKENIFKQAYGTAIFNAENGGEDFLNLLKDLKMPDGSGFLDSFDMSYKVGKGAEEVVYMGYNAERRNKQSKQDAEREARDKAMFELYRDYLSKGDPVPPDKMLEFAEVIGVQELSQFVGMSQNIAQGWFPRRNTPELGYGPDGKMTEKEFKRASSQLKAEILFDLMNGSAITKEQLYAMTDYMTEADRKEIIKAVDDFHAGNNELLANMMPLVKTTLSEVSASLGKEIDIDSSEGQALLISGNSILNKLREQMQSEGRFFDKSDPNYYANTNELYRRLREVITPELYPVLLDMAKSNCTVDNISSDIQTRMHTAQRELQAYGDNPLDEPMKQAKAKYIERLAATQVQAKKLSQLMNLDTGVKTEARVLKANLERDALRRSLAKPDGERVDEEEKSQPPQKETPNPIKPANGYKPMSRPTGKPNLDRWSKDVTDAAKKYGIPEALIYGTMLQESGGNMLGKNGKTLTSSAGALGLMQLMPATAKGLGVNPHNPRENIMGGAKYLRQMLDMFGGDVEKAAWAYNAGPKRVREGKKPKETRGYIPAIVANYRRFSQA